MAAPIDCLAEASWVDEAAVQSNTENLTHNFLNVTCFFIRRKNYFYHSVRNFFVRKKIAQRAYDDCNAGFIIAA